MDKELLIELYILLKVKCEYNQSRKDAWIYKRLKEPEMREYNRMLHDCRDRNLIESRGERNMNCSLYYRDLFLTPYGERRLNRLETEYMNGWWKKFFLNLGWILGVVGSVSGFLSFLLSCLK